MLQVCNCIYVLIPYYVEKFYLVDSGYPNRMSYLAPYKETKYHLKSFGKDQCQEVKRSSLIIRILHFEMSSSGFGVLKMKWRILLDLPSYPMAKQSQIVMAYMAVHNFIRVL